ncbi:MAG: hypothetical protein RL173_44 [Fibrobacterota bacterium]|jgi:hypothetical protein
MHQQHPNVTVDIFSLGRQIRGVGEEPVVGHCIIHMVDYQRPDLHGVFGDLVNAPAISVDCGRSKISVLVHARKIVVDVQAVGGVLEAGIRMTNGDVFLALAPLLASSLSALALPGSSLNLCVTTLVVHSWHAATEAFSPRQFLCAEADLNIRLRKRTQIEGACPEVVADYEAATRYYAGQATAYAGD